MVQRSRRCRWSVRACATRWWRATSGPVTGVGVLVEGVHVGELVWAPRNSCGDVVVAGFADVGVGAGARGGVAGAVAVRETGLQHLGVEPPTLSGSRGLPTGAMVNWRRIRPIASRRRCAGWVRRGSRSAASSPA